MRAHFIRLFDFDYFASQAIFKAMEETAGSEKALVFEQSGDLHRPLILFAHLQAASQAWLRRCEGESSAGIQLWPQVVGGSGLGPDAEMLKDQVRLSSLKESIDNNHRAWTTFLKGEGDFGRSVTYQNQSGQEYTNLLSDLLTHIINHGTHHRAQIGQLLKAAGLEKLPNTDYITYLRMTAK